jgi:hypothetical protein
MRRRNDLSPEALDLLTDLVGHVLRFSAVKAAGIRKCIYTVAGNPAVTGGRWAMWTGPMLSPRTAHLREAA